MRGRQKGRPTKWVYASVEQGMYVDLAGFKFDVWEKWARTKRKVGTLTVSVGGLRWLPPKGKAKRWKKWDDVALWLSGEIQ